MATTTSTSLCKPTRHASSPLTSNTAEADDAAPGAQAHLLSAFVACRTTLEDLSRRITALGQNVSSSLIAAHLTGKVTVSTAEHNAVAQAINERLGELSLPPSANRTFRSGIRSSIHRR